MTWQCLCTEHNRYVDEATACVVCGDTRLASLLRASIEAKRAALDAPPPALAVQVGGDHYKGCAIQPIEFIHANGIGFAEGNVIKYVSRWRAKGGVEDLRKARHYLDLLIDLESKAAT